MSLVCEKVKKKIQEEVKIGKPIPIEAYRQALKNSYIADGMEPSAAEYSAEKTIETSVRYAELVFEEDASNCFRAEALARRREQNLEESQKTN